MNPVLHNWYTRDEAISAFGGDAVPEVFCDEQFVVLPKVVLCLATIGKSETEPHVSCPSRFVWKPTRLDYEPSNELFGQPYESWLPTKVREVCDRSLKEIKRIRDHHVFLRSGADERFFYAGRAHLGSYGGPLSGGNPADRCACFSLDEKLPRKEWLRFGGYPGWLVDINHQTHRMDYGDVSNFEQFAKGMTAQEFSHLQMTRYEEDSLTLHTNGKRGWLMYQQDPLDSGLYTQDAETKGNPDALEDFKCVCGITLEFPVKSTLPRDLAVRAAAEFFASGELPRSIHWTRDWPDMEEGDIPESTDKPAGADEDIPF